MKIPGFIDLQVNGYAGIDINNPATTPDQIIELSEILAAKGTAAFLATIITAEKEIIEQCVQNVAQAIKKQEKPGRIMGIHLEGPFISAETGYRGAHPINAICDPDLKWFTKLQKISNNNIRMVTLAPEKPNAIHFIKNISPDILISVGHSNCSYNQLRTASGAGLSLATHIGNACAHQVDRHKNPIVRTLAISDITLCFIADGLHLPKEFIYMLLNTRPIEKLIVVSDSVSIGGLQPGSHTILNGTKVILEENGRISLDSNRRLMAGSSSNMLECMNYMASLKRLSVDQLLAIGYYNPMKLLNENIKPEHKLAYSDLNNQFSLI